MRKSVFDFFRRRRSLVARQLGLIDCGKVGRPRHADYREVTPRGHSFCNTVLRVGIEKESGITVKYCWRCQEIIDRLTFPAHPHPSKIPENGSGNIVAFAKKKDV